LVVLAAACETAVDLGAHSHAPAEGGEKSEWPSQSFWDKVSGYTPPPPLPPEEQFLNELMAELNCDAEPLSRVLADLARQTGTPIRFGGGAREDLRRARITLHVQGKVCLRDALDLVMMQASPTASHVYYVEQRSLEIRRNPNAPN